STALLQKRSGAPSLANLTSTRRQVYQLIQTDESASMEPGTTQTTRLSSSQCRRAVSRFAEDTLSSRVFTTPAYTESTLVKSPFIRCSVSTTPTLLNTATKTSSLLS